MASATENAPKRKGPQAAKRSRQEVHRAAIRSTSLRASGRFSTLGVKAATSMLMCWRRAWKPACISALTERASARRAGSAGHSALPRTAASSATYSQMARESQTVRSPSISTGTLPEGE